MVYEAGVCGFESRTEPKKILFAKVRLRPKGLILEFFRHYVTFFRFFSKPNLPLFSAETTAFYEHRGQLLVFRHCATYRGKKIFDNFFRKFSQFLVFCKGNMFPES